MRPRRASDLVLPILGVTTLIVRIAGLCGSGAEASPTLISPCRERLPGRLWSVGDTRSPTVRDRFDGVLHLRHDDQRRLLDVLAEGCERRASLTFDAGPEHGEAVGSPRGDALHNASLETSEYDALLTERASTSSPTPSRTARPGDGSHGSRGSAHSPGSDLLTGATAVGLRTGIPVVIVCDSIGRLRG